MKPTNVLPVGHRIRRLRRQKGWSLNECQLRSQGRVKAVTLASYERGERSISLARLALIAELFNVSIEYFLVTRDLPTDEDGRRHIYDLHALSGISPSREKDLLLSFLAQIIQARGDWQGAVISLRGSDISTLQILFAAALAGENASYMKWVESQKFLINLKSNA